MEILLKIILGIFLGAAIVPVAFGVFFLSLFLVGAIFYGLFRLAMEIYIRLP